MESRAHIFFSEDISLVTLYAYFLLYPALQARQKYSVNRSSLCEVGEYKVQTGHSTLQADISLVRAASRSVTRLRTSSLQRSKHPHRGWVAVSNHGLQQHTHLCHLGCYEDTGLIIPATTRNRKISLFPVC